MDLARHVPEAAFFALAAIVLITRRGALLDFGAPVVLRGVPRNLRARFDAAYRRHAQSEAFPTQYAGLCVGSLSLAFVPLVALTDIPFNTVLAALVFVAAFALATTYTWLRLTQRRFTTTLAVRIASTAVPRYAWLAASMASALPLLWLGTAPIGASLFALGGLTIVAVAFKIAARPSAADGVDRGVDAFVDLRVRATRYAALCALAIVPAYFFEATTPGELTTAMRVALVIVPLGIVCTYLRLTVRARKSIKPEVARWAHAAQ